MNHLYDKLSAALGRSAVYRDDLTLIASAADAGCYQKIPQVVLKPASEREVLQALSLLHREEVPVTFRAAGTSLSGQAISDSVLLQARGDQWSKCQVLDHGRRIKVRPGITGARINQVLSGYGTKFGPDPASINSAMVGGIIANNASGMSCGIHANSYATIESARIIFADGTLLDTSDPESRKAFKKKKSALVNTVLKIRDRIRNDPDLVKNIRKKYRIKNTTGYGMNSFLDYDDPMEIILHLMVGSEGTLGFVSEATFRTIPVKPFRASSLIYFSGLEPACDAVPLLRRAGVPAIEIMDREALRSVEGNPGIPGYIGEFHDSVTALLIDLEAGSQEELHRMVKATGEALEQFRLVRPFEVTLDRKEITALWNVRKGVFPSVGGMRPPGTSVIIEDVAVSGDHLTGAVTDLRKMLNELGYGDAVIYGHVLDGNLHFIFAQDFHRPDELKKYRGMIERLTRLIVDKYDGSLKAEHGTGLNMAPFVACEWGDALYHRMKEIKQAFDPRGILNPGVIISDDPQIHLKHFKPMPLVHESVDQCIECGFCEINCLTSGLTLSARQRIVVRREVQRLQSTGEDPRRLKNLEQAFRYQGDQTCAGDGLCAITCPLSIDTGVLIKHLREKEHEKRKSGQLMARWIAGHFSLVHRVVRFGLGFMQGFYRVIPIRRLWIWDWHMPRPVRKSERPVPPREGAASSAASKDLQVVYFPSCLNQSMGTSVKDTETRPLVEVTVEVLERAGYSVIYPRRMDSLCCGTPWESKGFPAIADAKAAELEKALLEASDGGRIPVLCDTSPCTYRMIRVMSDSLKIYEPVEFIHDHLLDKLKLKRYKKPVAFHITCTSTKMGLEEKFRKVAEACTRKPVFPEEVGCCGFAGDKGFSLPEVNRFALRNLREQVAMLPRGYSNSRTCEIGLSRNSSIDYKSVMYLVLRSIDKRSRNPRQS